MDDPIARAAQAATPNSPTSKLEKRREKSTVVQGQLKKLPQVTISHGRRRIIPPQAGRPRARSVTVANTTNQDPWD